MPACKATQGLPVEAEHATDVYPAANRPSLMVLSSCRRLLISCGSLTVEALLLITWL